MAQAELHCVVSAWPIGHTCVCDKAIDGIQAMPLPSRELPILICPAQAGRGKIRK